VSGPFAAARVTVRTYGGPGGECAPTPDWAEVLTRYAVVVVDHGWLRLLGAGGHGLPALFTPVPAFSSGTSAPAGPASRLMVGFDVLGGMFAVGDGVEYFAPDGLEWLPLGLGDLDELVDWALGGGLAATFGGLRWTDWAAEIRFLPPDQGVSVHPPLWSEEGQDIDRCVRGVTPLPALAAAHHEAAGQLRDVTDGEQVTLAIID
jgi:uncharacterized protein DUF2625